jgi:hypothetical protein
MPRDAMAQNLQGGPGAPHLDAACRAGSDTDATAAYALASPMSGGWYPAHTRCAAARAESRFVYALQRIKLHAVHPNLWSLASSSILR